LTKPILSCSEQTGTVGVVEGRGSINGRDKKEKCSDRKENSGGNNIYQLVNQNISNHQNGTSVHNYYPKSNSVFCEP
jgi:hypothetical protein